MYLCKHILIFKYLVDEIEKLSFFLFETHLWEFLWLSQY